MISKILIANRGEIALRVIRTCADLGLKSVAVYCDEDRGALFTNLADEAYCLDGSGFGDTYLNGDKILAICKKSGANALHPGYGFLSENADFARKCEAEGVKWLGPSGDAIDALGDKVKARLVADKAGVSPVPGISDFISSENVVREFVIQHGYPVILKRADGGGGHGITVVRTDKELENFLIAHSHDLNFYFIERFVENARHVETQCARDQDGNFTVVSTRDCSVQRRNQKLIEEAPAPFLSDTVSKQIFDWSKSLFETVDYTGLGTCEYLLETKQDLTQSLYFLEVNPRLQVEHTVSEEVSGLDLVREQINIANGKNLTKIGNLVEMDGGNYGHSIELRITSEDPYQNMTPTAGVIKELDWPQGHGIRLESGVKINDKVTTDFDSMIAKIIITAQTRDEAIARTKRALREFKITGISTPTKLFEVIFNNEAFTANSLNEFKISTKWLENAILPDFIANNADKTADKTAVSSENSSIDEVNLANSSQMQEFQIEIDGKLSKIKLPQNLFSGINASSNAVTAGNAGFASFDESGVARKTAPRLNEVASNASANTSNGLFSRSNNQNNDTANARNSDPSKIISPMQGIVVNVAAQIGQNVQKGDLVIVLEAMKMENFVHANADGKIKEIFVKAGDSIEKSQVLVELEID